MEDLNFNIFVRTHLLKFIPANFYPYSEISSNIMRNINQAVHRIVKELHVFDKRKENILPRTRVWRMEIRCIDICSSDVSPGMHIYGYICPGKYLSWQKTSPEGHLSQIDIYMSGGPTELLIICWSGHTLGDWWPWLPSSTYHSAEVIDHP